LQLDVFFDDEFFGGKTSKQFDDRRSNYRLPPCSVLNLTHQWRVLMEKHQPRLQIQKRLVQSAGATEPTAGLPPTVLTRSWKKSKDQNTSNSH